MAERVEEEEFFEECSKSGCGGTPLIAQCHKITGKKVMEEGSKAVLKDGGSQKYWKGAKGVGNWTETRRTETRRLDP